ncbi:hypothetical protein Aduo_018410 [Ancylostoma duodenale]
MHAVGKRFEKPNPGQRKNIHEKKRKQLRSEEALKLELSAFFGSKKRSFFDYGIRSLARRWWTVIDHHDYYIQ